ncbi:MAG: ion channel [Xenococcaceae cyanobacterium MO_207.B15]|nr:ion channel [Xenococcaceae cyanobacterium MO_207.B15]MDJ0747612.1 ion channel [Xenococcaceae cyanobacterium MO_167.B27]
MKLDWWKKSIQNRYSQLLAIIILLFLLSPTLEGTAGQIIISAIFLGTIIAIIRTFNLNKRFFFLLLMFAATSFTLDVYTKLQGNIERDKLFQLVIQIIYCLFILAALVTINRKIFSEKKVSADTIKGGISVFFLIGIVWGLLYSMIYLLDPDAFSYSGEGLDSLDSMFYFSFTTLTTLGYGDITPVSNLARTLANLQAIAGMMYPSIFIARLVGLYTAQEMTDGQ